MTDTPPSEPTPEKPSTPPSTPPSEPPQARRPPKPDDNWPDFSTPPPAPPTGPGYPPPHPGYGRPAWGPGGPPPPNPQEDRTLATIAHLGGIIAGFIPSLIIYLVKRDTSPWVRKQAAEALNFQITVTIASFISGILMIVIIGFVLIVVVWVLNIVLCIIGGVAANRGEIYEYPAWTRIKMID